MIMTPNANVRARMDEPAKAPMPTLSDSCASAVGLPNPENNTIMPSGTAPKKGRMTAPIKGAYGVSNSNSLPSPITLDACNNIYPYTAPMNNTWTRFSMLVEGRISTVLTGGK